MLTLALVLDVDILADNLDDVAGNELADVDGPTGSDPEALGGPLIDADRLAIADDGVDDIDDIAELGIDAESALLELGEYDTDADVDVVAETMEDGGA